MGIQQEMQKSARWIAFFLLVCTVVSLAALGYVIRAVVIDPNTPQAFFTGLNWQSDYTDVNLGYLCVVMIRAAAILVALAIAFTIFRDIGKGSSPFTSAVTKRISAIGTLLIIAATIAWPVGSLAAKALWPGQVSYPVLISIDWGTLVFGFIISCLASVFRYGCVLQRESDETL